MIPYQRNVLSACLIAAMSAGSASALAEDDSVRLMDLEVVGTTPIGGVGLPADDIAANVQSADAADIERSQGLDISDFLNKNFASISLNQAQNNPFQPDLKYRGFTASPLVGNSQGLSVYLDGVRVNEPFGDAINFELIPQSAIADMNLIPGSNPVFGLNTLGGALSMETKNGFDFQEHSLEAYTGSFGRDSGTIESGGSDGNLAYYVTGSITKEDGWRDFSPSRVEQLFSKFSYADEDSTLDLSLMGVDSDLNGNGASPVELVAQDREAVFTHPDNTRNKLRQVSLNGTHWLRDDILLSANTYFRRSDRSTFNGDGSELDVDGGQIIEEDDNEVIASDAAALGFADGDDVALNNTSQTDQDSFGFALQSTFMQPLFGRDNQLTVGMGYDHSDVDYSSESEIAQFTSTRGTAGTGFIIDETMVDGNIETDTYSIFFTNTHALTERLDLTLGGRYNWIAIDISGTSEGGEQNLNESGNTHNFKRFNPSVGLTYALQENTTAFASYSESNRAPTPSELTCSEPESPCAYPNAFLADPPLDDVVARTVEAGLRGQQPAFNWSANAFYTQLEDDLFFFPEDEAQSENTAGRLGLGNFRNLDKTARAGIELALNGQADKLSWFANYAYVRATFEDDFTYSRQGELYNVSKGDRLPGIPEHNIKIGADYAFTPKLSAGVTASYHSSQYFRGDEANVDKKIAHYKVVNLHGRYQATENLEFFAKVDNLFDSEYETFGLYGEADEAPGLDIEDPRFVGAGAPRAGWIGFKLTL